MRCARARQWMTAAADRELGARRTQRLERHLAACPACRDERARTIRLLDALAALPATAAVPPRLEQDTLRRVRLAAAEDGERRTRRGWWLLGVPAAGLAALTAVLLAVGPGRQAESPSPPRQVARAPRPAPAASRPAPVGPSTPTSAASSRPTPPAEPPPELAAEPDLFVDLPILQNLDKLRHYEAIRTTTLDDRTTPTGDGERSNG
jgi:hypothetical protein